jgi:hypothetical protein
MQLCSWQTRDVTGERWLRSTERPCAPSQSTNRGIFVSRVSKHQPNIGGLVGLGRPAKTTLRSTLKASLCNIDHNCLFWDAGEHKNAG